MAKLVLVLLVYFLASACTSCSASRSLGVSAALSADKSDSATVFAKSSVFTSASAPPATESGVVSIEKEEPSDVIDDVLPSCADEDLEDFSVEGGRPCHRSLVDATSFAMLDYAGGTGTAKPNPKP